MKHTYIILSTLFFLCLVEKPYAFDISKEFQSGYKKNIFFSREEFEEDMNYLIDALEQGHPNALYLHNKSNLEKVFEGEPKKAQYSAEEIQRTSLKVLHVVGDDHSGVYPFGDEEFYPPYKMKRIGNKFYVLESSDKEFQIGDEITQINNLPVDEVWADLGNLSKSPYGRIMDEVIYKNFKELMSLQYKIPAPDYKKVTIKIKHNTFSNSSICGEGSSKEIYLYECEGIPVLKIKKFKYEENDSSLIFNAIDKHKDIIIDLRDNEGGSLKLTKKFFEKFIEKGKYGNFFRKNAVLLKGSKYSKISYDMRLNFLFKKILYAGEPDRAKQAHWGNDIASLFYADAIYEKAFFQGESNVRYREIYILVNSNTGSAAALVAGLFKEYLNATIVGQEMFGSYKRFFWDPIFIVLPNSQLRVNFSSAYTDRTGTTDYPTKITWPTVDDLGVQPDIHISDSVKDFMNGTDSVLYYAVKKIKSE